MLHSSGQKVHPCSVPVLVRCAFFPSRETSTPTPLVLWKIHVLARLGMTSWFPSLCRAGGSRAEGKMKGLETATPRARDSPILFVPRRGEQAPDYYGQVWQRAVPISDSVWSVGPCKSKQAFATCPLSSFCLLSPAPLCSALPATILKTLTEFPSSFGYFVILFYE